MTIQARRLATLAAAFLLAWHCAAAAQPLRTDARPIDLPAAIELALAQPALRAAAHEVAANEAAAGDAGRFPNPELDYLREGQRAGTRTTTVQIRQPIELGGKRRARVALAEGAVALARTELAARRQDLRADAIAGFYALLIAQEREVLAHSLVELARRGADVAARRVAAGKSSPIDATRARLAVVDASSELGRASGEVAIARTTLAALTGLPAETLTLASRGADKPPAVKPLAALQAALGGSLAVQRARGQLAAQAAQVEVERAARMPDVTVSVGSQRDEELGRRQAVVGLSLPLPLFNRNQGKLGAALRRMDGAQDELAAVQASAAAELAGLHTRYEVARNEAASLREEVLPAARSAHALTLKGFEYGKFSFLDVLDAQRSLFQAQARHWNVLLEAWRAYADIERLAGAGAASGHDTTTELETHP